MQAVEEVALALVTQVLVVAARAEVEEEHQEMAQ